MNPKFIYRILSFVNLVLLVLWGNNEPVWSQVFPFHHYTVDQGLVSNGVNSLLQDSRGYLWIGTGEGISLFDGETFRNFRTTEGLALNIVTSLSESHYSQGTILIGTWGGGISRLSDGKFTTLFPDSTWSAKIVSDVEEDHRGVLWCVTLSGVYRRIEGTFSHIPATKNASAILIGSDSLVWIAVRNTILTYAPGSGEELSRLSLPIRGEVNFIHQYQDGSFWITTSDSFLIRLINRDVSLQRKIPFGAAVSIANDAEGTLWLGTTDGVVKLPRPENPESRFISYGTVHGIPFKGVKACLVDFENNLWLANEGMVRVSDANIQSFPLNGVPESYNNCKAVTDERGHIWAIAGAGVLEVWKDQNGQWQSYMHKVLIETHRKSLPTIVYDRRKRLWFDNGSEIEGYYIDSNPLGHSILRRIIVLVSGIHLPKDPRFFFILDSKDNFWVSTFGRGVYKVSPLLLQPKFTHYTATNGLPHDDIRVIYEDSKCNIWFGAVGQGVSMFSGGFDTAVVRYTTTGGLPDEFIRGIIEDKEGRIWIGTRRDGIGIESGGKFKHISVNDGLLGSAVWALAADDAGNKVWAGTQLGVQSIDQATLIPSHPTEALRRKPVTSLGTYRGQFLWFVASDALTVYEYGKARMKTPPPRAYITKLIVSGMDRDIRTPLEFTYDQNVCVFQYLGISYRETGTLRFQYRLLGVDPDWQSQTSQRTVTYASLSPGSYTFEVRAINGEGIASQTSARLSFVITPPFWATWWFIGFSIGACGGILALIIRIRIRRLLEIERLRSRIARDLHDEIGSNLSSIAMASDLLGRQSDLGVRERGKLSQISSIALTTVRDMKDIVWLINPKNDALDDLLLRMKDAAATVLEGHQRTLDFPERVDRRKVSLDWKRNVYLIYKECLTNIIKHAHATEVKVKVRIERDKLSFQVGDDGSGFDPKKVCEGNGLKNMQERATMLEANLVVDTNQGRGTTVRLETRIT